MPDFAILFTPENLLMALGCATPIQILYDWLLQRIIPPKSRRLFWGTLVPTAFVMCLARPLLSPELRMLIALLNSIVIPAALLEGSLVHRLVVCCISMILMVMAELGAGVAWIGMTGLQVMDPGLALVYMPQYLAAAVVGYGVVMVPGMTGLRALYRRVFPGMVEKGRASKVRKAGKAGKASGATAPCEASEACDVGEASGAQGAGGACTARDACDVGKACGIGEASGMCEGPRAQSVGEVCLACDAHGVGKMSGMGEGSDSQEASRWLASLWLLPLFQVPFVFVVMNVAFDELKGELPYVLTTLFLIALCIAADVFLFAQVSRSIEQRRSEAEAALLEERLAKYLDESSAMQDLLEDAACMRHDLRNHQAVVQALCKRGEVTEAAAYLAEASELLRAADATLPATVAVPGAATPSVATPATGAAASAPATVPTADAVTLAGVMMASAAATTTSAATPATVAVACEGRGNAEGRFDS